MSSQTGDIAVTPARRIRAGIDQEGLTVEEFAVSLGVASRTVSRWLREENAPRRVHARRLAERWGGHWTDYAEHEAEEAA